MLNSKTFVERPINIFNNPVTRASSLMKALLTQYSGFKLWEEDSNQGFMKRRAQIYCFGDAQIFWVPSMVANPLYQCNELHAVINSGVRAQLAENRYSILTNVVLVNKSEQGEREWEAVCQKFLKFEFNFHNASDLDIIILQGDLEKLKSFLNENLDKSKTFLTTDKSIQIVSIPSDESRHRVLAFNCQTKKYVADLVAERNLEPIVTNISTLDLTILVRDHNPEIYNLLITEFVLSLNTDPRVIEQLVALLAAQQSHFDVLRSKSKPMENLINILNLSIKRNGAIKVEQWIDDVKLSKYISAADREAFKKYLSENFIDDDIEMQRSSANKQKF